jgi:hypothetical protein
MSEIYSTEYNPYFAGIDPRNTYPGAWFACADHTISLSAELEVGAGTITAELLAEFTADPTRAKGISRVLLPWGCLHTALTTITLATSQQKLDITAMTSGAFTVSFARSAVGSMRFRWVNPSPGTGGASPNVLTAHLQIDED